MRTYVVDMDDLCDATAHRLPLLAKLKEKYPALKVTLFTIPARTSVATIDAAKVLGDWVALGVHGHRHTRGECLAWTKEEALYKINAAKEMGIDAPLFRAPGWFIDGETYEACKELGYVVCTHKDHHKRMAGVQQYVYNMPNGRAKDTISTHGHLTQVSTVDNFIGDMLDDGRLSFARKATFLWPHEAAVELAP